MEDTVTIQRCHSHLIIPKSRYKPNKHVLVEEVKNHTKTFHDVNPAQNLNNIASWKSKPSGGFSKKTSKHG